jgi:hypothetical protein
MVDDVVLQEYSVPSGLFRHTREIREHTGVSRYTCPGQLDSELHRPHSHTV